MAARPRGVVGGRGNLDDGFGVGEGLGGLPGPFFVQCFGIEFGGWEEVVFGREVQAVLVEGGLGDGAEGDGVLHEDACVGAGELESVDEAAGAGGRDAVLRHGGDEEREGELDGVEVLERGQFELEGAFDGGVVLDFGGVEVAAVGVLEACGVVLGGDGVVVAAVGAVVVVAEGAAGECGRTAAVAVDADVTAGMDLHVGLSPGGGVPPHTLL